MQPQLEGKVENPNLKIGIAIIIVAIVLIILAICTDFYGSDKTLFGGRGSGEKWSGDATGSGKYEVTNYPSEISGDLLEIYFFDVGQGDCIFARLGDKTMLIDAGNNPDGKFISKHLRNSLSVKRIDYLIGTHAHEDHIGGLDIILEDFDIGSFYMPVQTTDTKTYNDVVNWAVEKNVEIINPNVGDTFNFGQAVCEFMAQDKNTEDLNESSIVLELTYKNNKFLFTGDITSYNEEARSWNDIDVLKVAHHGSTYSTTANFLQEVKPEYAIISCGRDNDYYYPHEAVLQRLSDANCKNIYVTAEDNTIFIISDGNRIDVYKIKVILDGNT